MIWIKCALLFLFILFGLLAVFLVVGLMLSVYYSIPYDEWVEDQKELEKRKAKKKKKEVDDNAGET